MEYQELLDFVNSVGIEKVYAIYCDNDKMLFYFDEDMKIEDIVNIGGIGYVKNSNLVKSKGPVDGKINIAATTYIPTTNIQTISVVDDYKNKKKIDTEYYLRS